eukprot:GHVR01174380.1.p1 GENE.GHVR01174380.1~~GHVR01174380.1.p1  ORF type:complete len:268 (-),score=59.61 GHVR01174380.1:193-996(-)
MKKIFITRKLVPIIKELLRDTFEVHSNEDNTIMSRDKLILAVQTYDGILTTIPDKIDKDILSHAGPNLKVICNYATGLDNIDIDYANKINISVYNTPDAVTNATADHTFAAFLSFLRKIPEGQQYVKDDKWTGWDPWLFLGYDLDSKVFGIIGYGRIGKAVARRALGFGLKVLYYNRSIVNDNINDNIKQVTLDELLCKSDYISIHLPCTYATTGFIDLNMIKKMIRKPIIINTSRGAIINTLDLVESLTQGFIKGVCVCLSVSLCV